MLSVLWMEIRQGPQDGGFGFKAYEIRPYEQLCRMDSALKPPDLS